MQAASVFHCCKTAAFIRSLTTQMQEYEKGFEIFFKLSKKMVGHFALNAMKHS